MVRQPIKPSEIGKKHKRSRAVQIALDALTLILVAGATFAIFRLTTVKPENQEKNNPEVVNKVPTDKTEDDESPEWLSKPIAQWLTSYPRNFRAGVAVYDFDNDALIGQVGMNDNFTEQASSELGAEFNMDFAVVGQTNASEMLEMLKTVHKHNGMSEIDFANLKERLLAQPDIISEERCQGPCRTRYGLPAGFKLGKVYNENYMRSNGSFFLAYRDAALLEFATNDGRTRNFAVVLLAEYFSDQAEFAKLGTVLEEAIVAHFENEPLK